MKMACFVLLCLALLCSTLYVNGQPGPDPECLTEDLLMDAVGCVTAKFEDLADEMARSLDPYTSEGGTGRKLQSTIPVGSAQAYVPALMGMMDAKHQKVLRQMLKASAIAHAKAERDFVIHSVGQMPIHEIFLDYTAQLFKLAAPLQQNVFLVRNLMRLYQDNSTEEEDDCPPFLQGSGICSLMTCLDKFSMADMEDGLDWLQCLYECEDLTIISQCAIDHFTARCPDWLMAVDFMMRIITDFLHKEECYFKILSPTADELPISLPEGGELQYVELRTYLPPTVHCISFDRIQGLLDIVGVIADMAEGAMGCEVSLQFSTSNYVDDLLPNIDIGLVGVSMGKPKCLNGSLLSQAVVGWHDNALNESCRIILTDDNWNHTFRVPVRATVDHKVDGDVEVPLTVKLLLATDVLHTEKLPMQVIDKDPAVPSTCHIVNDPHITTFDGFYYNNHYEGYFQMYKHKTMYYEVQGIYQKCTSDMSATCTCAVAVRSGDDVFVIDKCRRVNDVCSGDSCPLMTVTLYVNGNLTEGTRILKQDGGLRYDVVLPYGTIVKVQQNKEALSVWITPSPYDFDQTSGLCGTFNENKDDDLTLSNGSVDTTTQEREQARDFSQSWRVDAEDRIYEGAPTNNDEDMPLRFCRCHHVVLQGVQCHCNNNAGTDTCDSDLHGDLTDEELGSIWRHSRHENSTDYFVPDQRSLLLDIDVDETYEPEDFTWDDNTDWDEIQAVDHCASSVRSANQLTSSCTDFETSGGGFPPSDPYNPFRESAFGCEEDIQITDTDDWTLAAVEAAKHRCRDLFTRETLSFGDADPSMERFVNTTCLHDCNGRGECNMGVCECESDFAGGDCSYASGQTPTIQVLPTTMCDSRNEKCEYATIHGYLLPDDGSLSCKVLEAEVDSDGSSSHGDEEDVSVLSISPSQVACRLPRSGSYYIRLYWNGQRVQHAGSSGQDDTLFIVRDTACYNCDPIKQTCDRKEEEDHCFIDDSCYVHYETDPDQDCHYCNITNSRWEWSEKSSDECVEWFQSEEDRIADEEKLRNIRIVAAASLTLLTILCTLLAFYCIKKGEKKAQEDKERQEREEKANPTMTTQNSRAQLQTSMEGSAPDGGVDNYAMEGEQEAGPLPNKTVPPPEVKRAKKTRAERMSESESRDRAGSQSSVRSLGIGGGGPIGFSGFHPAVTDGGYMGGIGGYGPAGVAPIPHDVPHTSEHSAL